MWIELSKTLPYLVYPLTLMAAFIVLGMAFVRRRAWLGHLFLIMALALLLVSSSPGVARVFYASLEARYPPSAPSDLPKSDVIVVLAPGDNRARYAAALFRADRAPRILISGGRVVLEQHPGIHPEAHYLRAFLMELGVPDEAILVENTSRTTRENAVKTKRVLSEHGFNSVLLVTSAEHMHRAVRAFHAVGINATPAPTDYRNYPNEPLLLQLLPFDAGALSATTKTLREYLGHLIYSARGWM